jgi:CelD/BcsL family acetyltransferase involved in cellulose biosynthesis
MVTKLQTYVAEGARSLRPASLRVAVHAAPAKARDVWEALYAAAPASPYQAYAFNAAWMATLGRARGEEAFIVAATDDAGRPAALLPFVIRRCGPLRIARFACGSESNFNLPLLADAARDAKTAQALLIEAAKATTPAPDLFFLCNQPKRFDGSDNPLVADDAVPSPSFAYGAALPAEVAALEARFSKDSRKKLRKKETRLVQSGALLYEHAATGAAARDIIEALLRQKAARLAARGVASQIGDAAMRDFLLQLLDAAPQSGVEVHALRHSGEIVAAYVGLARGARFCAMLNSFTMDEEIARSSPGDLLLHALLRNLIARGFTHFDLGAGEARYKDAVCDETIELYDSLIAVTPLGALAGGSLRFLQRAKRYVKQTPWLFDALNGLRRRLKGRRGDQAAA